MRNSSIFKVVLCLVMLFSFLTCKKEENVDLFPPGKVVVSSGAGVTDIDGNQYTSLKYGNGQEWMGENLRVGRCSDGTLIESYPVWGWNNGIPCAVSCQDNVENDNVYGKLYNFYSVESPCNVCPNGWHVPTAEDWDMLLHYLDPNGSWNNNQAGGKMKNKWTGWASPNVDATNESAFSAFGSGYFSGSENNFPMYIASYFWSQTVEQQKVYIAGLVHANGTLNVAFYAGYGNKFYSIRCLKN